MKLAACVATVWFVSLGLAVSCLAQSPGIEELIRLDRLPVFKTSVKVGSVSSYDRTGGNDDGFSGKYSFVRKDADGLVLADLKGPGVIYRVWTPTPTDDVLEFLFDGEAKPRVSVKFRDLFLGNATGFPRPLAGFGAGGYYCYVPMPFEKSCVVRMRAEKVQFYQINYALYEPGTRLTSFQPQASSDEASLRDRACEVLCAAGTDISRFTAPPGAEVQRTPFSGVVEPNSTKAVFQSGSGGRIVGLKFSPVSAIAGKARDLLLRISFDGEAAAVDCPLGDFFGYAWGEPAMRGLFIGTEGDTSYCYFPMPFERNATVEVVSQRATPVELRAEVLHSAVPRSKDEGQFYAIWRRENPTKSGTSFTLVETQGRGHLVGVVLQAQGAESGQTLFFEGDDETVIDGETQVRGTGSEDFFNGGWYDVPDRWAKRLSMPLSGCLGYAKPLGRTGGYRFLVGDAYAYRKSIRQTIEHSGEKNNITTDYCSMTYLYSERRPTADLAAPPLADRKVVDPGEVVFPIWWQTPIHSWSMDQASLTRKGVRIDNQDVRCISLVATGQDWFGPPFFSPICDVPAAGRYAIYVEVVKGPTQARIQLFQNENPVADPVDFFAEEPAKSGRVLLGKLDLAQGPNNLMFKLVGKNDKATALGFDLVQVTCVREP